MADKRVSVTILKALMLLCCIPALGALLLAVLQVINTLGGVNGVQTEALLMIVSGGCTAGCTVCSGLRMAGRWWKAPVQLALTIVVLVLGGWLWFLADEVLEHSFCRIIVLPALVQGVLHLIWCRVGGAQTSAKPVRQLGAFRAVGCMAVGALGLVPLIAALLCLPYKFIAETDWAEEWPMFALVTGNVLTMMGVGSLYSGKKGWLWGFIGQLAGHVFLCWRLYEQTHFMSDGGGVASLVLWAGLLQAAAVAGVLILERFRKGASR